MDSLRGLHVVRNEWLDNTGIAWAQPEHLRLFGKVIGKELHSHHDPDLNAWVRANKAQTLDLLQVGARPSARISAIKLFENHISDSEFEELFLSNPESRFLFLKRRPIDSFISLNKARALKKWVGTDTTHFKVTLDADDYRNWYDVRARWFGQREALLQSLGRPYGMLSYEDDVLPGSKHMLDRLIEELAKTGFHTQRRHTYLMTLRLRKLAATLTRSQPHPDLGAQKQDRAASAAEKVENWAGFLTGIERQPGGIARLEEYSENHL